MSKQTQIKHMQDRLVVVTVEARSNPRLRPMAEAMRRTLASVIAQGAK